MKKLFLLLCLVAGFTACDNASDNENGAGEGNNPFLPIQLSALEDGIVKQSNDFAYKAFAVYDKGENLPPNYVMSPLSFSYALSMLANGAGGATQAEILKAIGVTGESMENANALYAKLMEQLPKMDKSTEVDIANTMWMALDFQPYDAFVNALKANYQAGMMQTDTQDALNAINKWCKEKTHGLIDPFLKRWNPETRMMLLNALYFKGKWAMPFDAAKTAKETFANEDGSKATVDMMNATQDLRYYEDNRFAMTEFPYGNGAFSIQFFLPKDGVSLNDCITELGKSDWNQIYTNSGLASVTVKMPKFTTETKESLIDVAKALGIKTAFSPMADYSNLAKEKVELNDIFQAAKISVDEKQTEAAAVTGVSIITGVSPTVKKYNFYLNRPFVYVLREKSTGVILFVGKVTRM